MSIYSYMPFVCTAINDTSTTGLINNSKWLKFDNEKIEEKTSRK